MEESIFQIRPAMTILSSLLEILLTPLLFGAAGIAVFGRRVPQAIPGLLFHSISSTNRLALSTVKKNKLKAILSNLKASGYTPLTIEEAFFQRSETAVTHSRRPILLTFDDGCRSFYTQALPLLEEMNIKTTIFPVAGFLGLSSSWDVMPSFKHLSKSEVKEISALGHEIGSHSLTHADFSYLRPADLTKELNDSKNILEDIVGKKVSSLSFPSFLLCSCFTSAPGTRASSAPSAPSTLRPRPPTPR